jgi:hypothetical protein
VCEKKHTSKSPQVQAEQRHSLRDGVNAYCVISPVSVTS